MYEILTQKDPSIAELLELISQMEKRIEKTILTHRPLLNGDRFLTDREVSEKLKISRRTLQEYRNNGQVAYIKLGGKIIYKEKDILEMLEKGYVKAFSCI